MISVKTWDVTAVLQETTAHHPFNFIVICPALAVFTHFLSRALQW